MDTKKKQLKLHIWLEWLCEKCGTRQDKKKNEEWQKHCGEMMKMQPYKQLRFN